MPIGWLGPAAVGNRVSAISAFRATFNFEHFGARQNCRSIALLQIKVLQFCDISKPERCSPGITRDMAVLNFRKFNISDNWSSDTLPQINSRLAGEEFITIA